MLRAEGCRTFKSFVPVLRSLIRQSVHKVGGNIVKPRAACRRKAVLKIAQRMYSAECGKHFVVRGLKSYTKPVYSRAPQCGKLASRHSTRITLHGYFRFLLYIKVRKNFVKHGGYIFCINTARRSAAEVYRVRAQPARA